MAKSNRRGEGADDDLEEALDDAVDDDAEDDDLEDDDEEPVSRSGGTATRSRRKADAADERAPAKREASRIWLVGRLNRFIREVVAELRKVIWPTRKELLTYTTVVVVFLAVMTSIVVGLDYVFAKGVLWVFGNPGSSESATP